MTTEFTHKRNSGNFGLSKTTGACGARGVKLASNPKHVNCPACLKLIAARQAEARERNAALIRGER